MMDKVSDFVTSIAAVSDLEGCPNVIVIVHITGALIFLRSGAALVLQPDSPDQNGPGLIALTQFLRDAS